jgi:hypothetical protein
LKRLDALDAQPGLLLIMAGSQERVGLRPRLCQG